MLPAKYFARNQQGAALNNEKAGAGGASARPASRLVRLLSDSATSVSRTTNTGRTGDGPPGWQTR